MVDHVFPEDSGTGATEGDWMDAASFAQLAAHAGFTDFVSEGLGFTYDSSGPTLDVASGVAVVSGASATAANTSETRTTVGYVVEVDARSDLSLTASDVNYVYLDVDLSAGDGVSIAINTTGSAPAAPSLKLGEVDTSADTTTETNRRPYVVDVQDGGSDVAGVGAIDFGTDLTVTDDGDGVVTVDASGGVTDTRTDVSDGGTQVVTDVTDMNFRDNLSVVDDSDGSVTIDASTGGGGGSDAATTVVSTESEFNNAISGLSPTGDPIRIVVDSDITFSSQPSTTNIPNKSTIEGSGHPNLEFTYTGAPGFEFDSQEGITLRDLDLEMTGDAQPVIAYNDSAGYTPYYFDHINLTIQPRGGGNGIEDIGSTDDSWGHLYFGCFFRHLDDGPGTCYIHMGGINNAFYNCEFTEIPNGGYQEGLVLLPSTTGQSWLFQECTFGGQNANQTGAGLKGGNQEDSVFIRPVHVANCSFEYMERNTGDQYAFAARPFGNWTFDNCYFRSLTTAIRPIYSSDSNRTARVRNCRFENATIDDYAIDMQDANQHRLVLEPYQTGLAINSTNSHLVDTERVVASGSSALSSNALTVDTGVSSTTARFSVDVGIQDPDASGVELDYTTEWDDTSGTHEVTFTDTAASGVNPTVHYRIVQTGV